MDGLFPALALVVGLIVVYAVARSRASKLSHIPSIGPSGPLSSYWGFLRFALRPREVITEGYQKYPNGAFRVPHLYNWLVFCSGEQMLEDIRKATDDELSIHQAMNESVQAEYTLSKNGFQPKAYQVDVVRFTLPRKLASYFPQIREEIQQAFEDNISFEGNEWKSYRAISLVMSIVSRATNRLLVGLPFCRDPEYLDITVRSSGHVMVAATILRFFPRFMRPLVAKMICKRDTFKKRLHEMFGDMLKERLKMEEQYGKDYPGKPDDLLAWFQEKAPPHLQTVDELITRIIATNFAAIFTTSLTFTHALYYLAAEPQHAAILRQEVDAIVEESGWTKAAIDRMTKIDSFLQESHRLNGIAVLNMIRVAPKDFVFSNGLFIPAGTSIAIPVYGTHHDESIYPDPDKFDPYRSARLRETPGAEEKRLVKASPDFLPWGYGKHACPGRFLAGSELKMMLAHIIYTYDVKFEQEGVRPPNTWLVGACLPSRKAEVMFRKRVN